MYLLVFCVFKCMTGTELAGLVLLYESNFIPLSFEGLSPPYLV